MTYIGIDIRKDSFVAAFSTLLGFQTRTYPNIVKGIRPFIGLLSVPGHHCVMEATGNYGFLLLYLFDRQGKLLTSFKAGFRRSEVWYPL